ncbi:hypothetical protein KKE06_03395 [Candidatus Micrarchaeota archaeon]|nr:hypothetical protein [Candidatus Micrarchaeota archaeon]MBU1929941.1 hypothetical protein [Candidatus Micrarchaeota archaeon]
MTAIIKRSGKRQKFSKAKIKRAIEKAAQKGKVSKKERLKIAREISEGISKAFRRTRSVRASEVRRRILQRLETKSKASVRAWQQYDRKRRNKKRR